MTDRDSQRPALAQPAGQTQPEGGDPDFAEEHEETAVDEDIITGQDTDREPESPEGWAGLEPDLSGN